MAARLLWRRLWRGTTGRCTKQVSTGPLPGGREGGLTEDGERVDVDGLGHAALAQQLGRHVGHGAEALCRDVGRVELQHAAQAEVRQPAAMGFGVLGPLR